ncbi:hypothetical protein [Luteimonas terrae]|uniref:Transmembrane protein n=1 Tax=Luteimonas terrae TaxID=1530191 RepID=A0ABU1XS28_9GAMM|nr:hypothetical protein [Luteimonas terrae]MDR7191543.1 hypothetical protein [Luteimonas terrae]
MIVPEYWAEARRQTRHGGRSVTVRRFGWSDDSEDAAQAHAELRVQGAFDAVLAGEALPRREPLTNYGVMGVPIREEIVERAGDLVITRNSYGALCLNTPDVLFADMDFEARPSGCVMPLATGVLVGGAAFAAAVLAMDWRLAAAVAIAVLVVANLAMLGWRRHRFDRDGGAEARALARVAAFSEANPDWHLRTYRTAAGLRVLVMHRTFDPLEPDVDRLFQALQADSLYATMCRLQHCFRARLTPKPWRLDMHRRIKPRSAAWSRSQARLPERLDWIADYEAKSKEFAACRYLRAFGTGVIDPKAGQVMAMHDAVARAAQALPLA